LESSSCPKGAATKEFGNIELTPEHLEFDSPITFILDLSMLPCAFIANFENYSYQLTKATYTVMKNLLNTRGTTHGISSLNINLFTTLNSCTPKSLIRIYHP